MSKLLKIALSQLGVKEIRGEKNNTTIVNYAKEAGFEWVNDDETPWCSLFLNWCAQKVKLERSKKANARSWLTTGLKIENPVPGDVVVYWRGTKNSWKGHVGLFLGYDQKGDQIFTLGGNQGNAVSIAPYSNKQLLGFRRLGNEDVLQIPMVILHVGNQGEEVAQLQRALRHIGLRVGSIDGIYGRLTTEAINVFQTRENLEIDGIYGPQTAKALKGKLEWLSIKA